MSEINKHVIRCTSSYVIGCASNCNKTHRQPCVCVPLQDRYIWINKIGNHIGKFFLRLESKVYGCLIRCAHPISIYSFKWQQNWKCCCVWLPFSGSGCRYGKSGFITGLCTWAIWNTTVIKQSGQWSIWSEWKFGSPSLRSPPNSIWLLATRGPTPCLIFKDRPQGLEMPLGGKGWQPGASGKRVCFCPPSAHTNLSM